MSALERAVNIDDLRLMAKRRLPRMVFDYIDGGAEDEDTLTRNRARYKAWNLVPDVLVDVSHIETTTRVMGADMAMPLIIAPTAATRLFHPRQGERAVAKAAAQRGLVYSISTLGSVSIEEIAALTPGPKWFQLYVWRDRELVAGILERVRAAGFAGVILTVDVPVAGNRERDPRNRFTVPPRINTKTVSQVLAKPGYLADMALSPKIGPANFEDREIETDIMSFLDKQFDPSITWDYAAWLKETWGGPLALKGIAQAVDAERAVAAGADAVWISNHGGRQLDGAPASIDCLPEIAARINGRADIILDGGVRRGADIVRALALGADAVAIGRPYLYGVAAAGEAGANRALEILGTELRRTMALTGTPSLRAIERRHVRPADS